MSSNSLIGWANVCKTGVLSAQSAASGLSPANLSLDQCSPSNGWQTANGVTTSASGATLQITGATNGITWRGVCLVNTNLTTSASVVFTLYYFGSSVASVATSGPALGYGQVVAIFDSDLIGDYIIITIDDPGNPDNHINVGGAFAGPMWSPATGITYGTTYGSTNNIAKTISRGGQEFRKLLYRQRIWVIEFDSVLDAEAWASLGELDRISAVGGNVFLVPNTQSANVFQEAIFGTLDSTSNVTFPNQTTNARGWHAQITERL